MRFSRNTKNHGNQRALASMVYKFFDKKTESGASVNEQFVEELHDPVIKKLEKRRVYARLKDNTWATGLAGMESLPSKNRNVEYFHYEK